MGQPRPAQEGEGVFNVLMVDFVFEGWDVCVGAKSTSIISNTNTIFTAFSGRRSMISHNQIQTDIKAFLSFAYKPVWELCSLLVSLQRGMYLNSHQSPQTCLCLRSAFSQGPFDGMARPKSVCLPSPSGSAPRWQWPCESGRMWARA